MRYIIFIWLGIMLGTNTSLVAQLDIARSDVTFTIPEIALLDIEPDNRPVIMSLQPNPNTPRSIRSLSATDNSKWLNYTCSLSPYSQNRSVYVEVNQGRIPEGMSVTVEASNAICGAGRLGKSVGQVLLTSTARRVIADIGGSYTGDGGNCGHNIRYTVQIDDLNQFDFVSEITLNVVYTITE